jgi:transposase
VISLTPHMRILCFTESVDFRRGLDGLLGICRSRISSVDPFSGTLFLFCNRSRKAIKGVVYDGQGFWLFMKRLSVGRFTCWPTGNVGEEVSEILARELMVLLWNGSPERALMGEDFKRIA